jgi:lipopolysaccharide/colanic/teichoic acid biosynthesis glycosyltransferase
MALEHAQHRPPDVSRAAERLRRPRVRAALLLKRAFDLLAALLLLIVLVPVVVLTAVLLLFTGEGWLETRGRLGRDGRLLRLRRFRRPPGAPGRMLERIGAREVPVLLSVATGRLSFVGPRPRPMGTPPRGARTLMAPGLLGPAQRWASDADTADELDDAYVEEWTLLGDAKLLFCTRCRPPLAVRR